MTPREKKFESRYGSLSKNCVFPYAKARKKKCGNILLTSLTLCTNRRKRRLGERE